MLQALPLSTSLTLTCVYMLYSIGVSFICDHELIRNTLWELRYTFKHALDVAKGAYRHVSTHTKGMWWQQPRGRLNRLTEVGVGARE